MVVKTKKIFVGGVSANTTEEDLRRCFEKIGKVEECVLMYDKNTNRNRGFGFVTFESEECAEKACEIHFHEINNRMQVEAKKAQPKEVMNQQAAAREADGLPAEYLQNLAALPGFPGSFFPTGFPAAYGTYAGRTGFPAGYAPVYFPAVINNFPQGYCPPTSPANSRGFPPATSPGSMDIYNSNTESLNFVQATSPQPSGFGHNLTGALIPQTFQNGFH